MKKIVLVIDGHCVMCNSIAIWISSRDKKNLISITNFESNYVKEKYPRIKSGKHVVLINENNEMTFEKSSAIIQCLKTIGYKKPVILMNLFPRCFRDLIYNIIAKYRYKIYGKNEKCVVTRRVPEKKILD